MEHIAIYLVIWLVLLVVLVLFLALMLHGGVRRMTSSFRFVFYLPGAFVGSASVLVWCSMLDTRCPPLALPDLVVPFLQPGANDLHAASACHLRGDRFFDGRGRLDRGDERALNNISDEVIDSAKIDGANAWQLAVRIKLPLIKRWVVFMLILAFAAGTQLFVEPQLVNLASQGMVGTSWSPNSWPIISLPRTATSITPPRFRSTS